MHILVISNLYPPCYLGGYELLCKNVVDALRDRGHTVFVLTSDFRIDTLSADERAEKDIARELKLYLPFGQPGRIARLRRWKTARVNHRIAAKFIREKTPDIIFVWSQLRLTLGQAYAAEASGVPVVYTMNDAHITSYQRAAFGLSPKQCAKWIVDGLLLKQNDAKALKLKNVVCISECVKRTIIDKGVPIHDAHVIYQGIPIEAFPCKEALGSVHDPARLLYCGQLHEYKGVHTAIEALARLQEKGTRARLSIAGRGDEQYEHRLRRLAEKLGVADAVDFLGRQPREKIGGLYRHHDVLVFTSVWEEPFGLTHLEAMASGTVVVSVDHGGPAEFLVDGENSLLFPAENAQALAHQIQKVIESESLRKKIATAGRKLVEERFTLDRYVDDIERFLAQVVNEDRT